MKKKIMIGALAALFLSVGIFAATNLQEKKQVSDLTLANIEAMTGPSVVSCCPHKGGSCYVFNNGLLIDKGRNQIECSLIPEQD